MIPEVTILRDGWQWIAPPVDIAEDDDFFDAPGSNLGSGSSQRFWFATKVSGLDTLTSRLRSRSALPVTHIRGRWVGAQLGAAGRAWLWLDGNLAEFVR